MLSPKHKVYQSISVGVLGEAWEELFIYPEFGICQGFWGFEMELNYDENSKSCRKFTVKFIILDPDENHLGKRNSLI